MARIGLWSVNTLARSLTKCNKVCDKRLLRLRNCTNQSKNYRQFCHVSQLEDCKLGFFQGAAFAGDFVWDSKSTSGGVPCVLGSHTLVPLLWMCKEQTAVSHSSAESEIISIDAALQMDGLPALQCWECVLETLSCKQPRGTSSVKKATESFRLIHSPTLEYLSQLTTFRPAFSNSSHSIQLYFFEDNVAVIQVSHKVRRVDMDWLFGMYWDQLILTKYVRTTDQLADADKGNATSLGIHSTMHFGQKHGQCHGAGKDQEKMKTCFKD